MVIILVMIWTDEDLMLLRKKDKLTFKRLFYDFQERIMNFLIIRARGNQILAEEVLSDTFYSAILSSSNLKNTNNILSWLIQIANRRFNDYLRREYRDKKYSDLINEEHALKDNIDKNPVDKMIEKEKELMTESAIEKIKPIYKNVLLMKYKEKKTLNEISRVLGKDVNAIKSILYRARESLKDKLSKEFDFY